MFVSYLKDANYPMNLTVLIGHQRSHGYRNSFRMYPQSSLLELGLTFMTGDC